MTMLKLRKPTRRRSRPCGARLEPSGELLGLPVAGPCEVCGEGVSEHGGHVLRLDCLMDCTGDRVWICADADDVELLRRTGVEDGDVILDRGEARQLVTIGDPQIVSEIVAFKRELPGGRLRGSLSRARGAAE